jgi:hypothetical protein
MRPSGHRPRQASGDLLQEPAVAVPVAERRPRAVGTVPRVEAVHATPRTGVVEHATRRRGNLAHVDAAADELGAGRLKVVDDEDQALDQPRHGGRDPGAEGSRPASPGSVRCTIRSPRPWRGRRPGATPATHRTGWPVDVRDRQDDEFELHVHGPGRGDPGRGLGLTSAVFMVTSMLPLTGRSGVP